ncbi:Protein of unknown function [Mesobacillus persicus]|uniref:Restriction endonuclease type II-like domain-containing protein n=1 Tax=Mesobacillus persicus TaxID=930146 RepID=A0A1H8JJP7_9BACI|nr:DUF559 domain-containing protein [Mesobacillus persicus]SEN80969.1 Protein of unknown function [Mesobacillus persicus]
MLIEYIVFFSLIAGGLIAFYLHKPGEPVIDYITLQQLKCESYIERRLYKALVSNGYHIRTQVPCGKYRIDLTLPEHKIAIECDGKDFHSTPEQKIHDRKKNAYLRKNGWKVIRFSGRQINRELKKVISQINKESKR